MYSRKNRVQAWSNDASVNLVDPTPLIVSQVSGGNLPGFKSRLGVAGGPAALHGIEALEPGMRLTAVEVAIPFRPLFPLGDAVYPSMVYDVAYF